MQNILLVAAIEQEMPKVSDSPTLHFDQLITKVGKVQAAVTLAKHLSQLLLSAKPQKDVKHPPEPLEDRGSGFAF